MTNFFIIILFKQLKFIFNFEKMIFLALSLLFAKGLNLTCSSSICPDIQKSNRQCNPECMTSYCDYDTSAQFFGSIDKKQSDCYENCVLDGCDPQNLGNGICDASCNTENCGYDWGDCTCSPGCLNSMLGDGNCDEKCDNWSCDLDNHDCGQCADGCFPAMLGNGVCDSACNNEDCLYDYKDCQCSDNCKWTDYGKCKPECMTLNCNYDKVDQYPNNWCQNKSLAIFSSYQQIIRNDFSYVVHLEDCYKASNYTCSAEKALNFLNCYQECNILECNYANGNCENYRNYYCRRSYNNFSGCLSCINNIVQVVTYLWNQACTAYINWDVGTWLLPDGSLVKMLPNDTSSAKNPHVYFVKPSQNANWISGNGTYYSQFSSLSYALSNVLYRYSIIYLSQSNYYTEQRPIKYKNRYTGNQYHNPKHIFGFLTSRNIKIKPLDNSPITIKRAKNDISLSIFWFPLTDISNLEVNNVIFDWKNTDSFCNNDNYCDYCPIVTTSSDLSIYYNDRDERIGAFLPISWCSMNNAINFFDVISSNLVFNNVSFINFRTDFNSIFWITNGSNLTLNNVTFDNIKVHNNDNSAIISWNSLGCLQFNKGTVSRVNNGYEIKDSIHMKGFLNVIFSKSISLRNVNFMYNVVLEPQLISTNRGTLLFLNIFQMLEIDSCIFIYNYCEFGIINIQPQYYDFSNETNDDGEIIYSTLNHIHIVNSNFTSNYGKVAGVLYSYYKYEPQNLLIKNSSFTLNGIETGPLIYIESDYINQKYLSDFILEISVNDQNVTEGKHLAKWLKIQNSSFVENYSASSGILEIVKMINIDLRDIFMVSNGVISSESMNSNSIILKYFIENPDMYIKLNATDPPDLNCESLSSISDSINFSLDKVSILNNYCKNYLPGIIISNTINSTISSSNFENNYGSGSNGICLTLNKNASMTIKDSFFISNKNNQPRNPGVINSFSDLLLQNCSFLDNIADLGGALYFVGQNLRIISSHFESNKSPSLNGGAVYYSLSLYDVKDFLFSIMKTTFTSNSCTLNGGGIFISKSSSVEFLLTLKIDNTDFYNNKAYAGSSLFIDGNVQLSTVSSINNCKFQENKASFSGTIWIYYVYGLLEINSCNFVKNDGLFSSGLNIGIGENNPEKISKLILNSCNFQFNTGNMTISLDNQNTNSTLETNYCLFEYNNGSVFSLDNGYVIDKNSRFQHNYSPNSGGVLNLKNSAIFVAENAIYINCSSSLNGGIASISLKSQYFCFSCKFTENSSKSSGGVIYADSDATFHIYNSILNKNSCKNRGSVIFMASVHANSSIDNSKVIENYSYGEGTIALLASLISINSSEISNNSVSQKYPGIHLEDSNAVIGNTSFSNQNGDEGCFILLSSSSVTIINSNFHDGFSNNSGAALHSTFSTLKIFSSTFLNLFSNSAGGSIYLYESSNLTLKDSIFINSNSSIDSYSSFIEIANTSFTNYSNSCIYGSQINLLAESSYFLNGYSSTGGGLYCSDCNNISIISSEFFDNAAQKGGAIYIENKADHLNSSQCNIKSSRFISNIAGSGGAIWANNINLNVFSSIFDENYAKDWESKSVQEIIDGMGGAIKIGCEESEIPCYFDISSNNFSNNWAAYKGGAINWDDSRPKLENNNFWNNSALYGNDIASFPAMMVLLNDTNQRALQYQGNSELNLNNIASGQNKNPPLAFALIDDISQIITTDCASQAQLQSSNDDLIISGTSIAYAVNGIFYFRSYIISAKPGSSNEIYVFSSAIEELKMNKSSHSMQMSSKLPIYVSLRLCEIGEAAVGLNCESCLENYYNIDSKKSKCYDCPSSAICYGNYTIVPKHGYWRDNKFTDHFWKCPYPPACLGSPDISNLSFTGKCAKGYENNMCHSCAEGYSRLYKNECKKCPSTVSNAFRLLGIFSLLVFMVIAIIKTSRKSAFVSASLSSIYIKIFWNYLQIMIIIATFSLNWPYEAVQLFYIQTCMDYIGAQLFSVDCFLQSLYSKNDVYYYKILITSLTPFSLAIICLLLWLVIYAIKKKSLRELPDDYLSTFTATLFLIHPSITNTMLSMFSCKEINSGEYWLYADLGIRCWNDHHLLYALLFALPTISIWVIAVPALCLIKLVKNRAKLEDISVKLKLGFLFNGYNLKHYYWEFLILYWKAILIILSVFFSNFSTNIQALTVALMLAIFLHIQAKNQPYFESLINKVEIFSIVAALITIIAGLFFITDDLDTIGENILLALLLLFNFLFIIYIAIQLLMQISIFKKCFIILANAFYIKNEKKYQVRDDLDYKNVSDHESKFITVDISSAKNLSEIKYDSISMEMDPFASENSQAMS
ncbi:unnamed protein product [Blepharisma stoltei]|uniref:PI-PLC Y-box domain-containing protein n=1 Tax=Blepharisma stoltei TaxID=1481888 RepID=A0AAU9JBG7_9CILI|nr:unnamed protein product [Blepharisma stoltei]